MRVMITGAEGMLGRTLMRRWQGRFDLRPAGRAAFDIRDADRTRRQIASAQVDVLIHCAAFSVVDDCEQDPDRAMAVNCDGAAHVAAACAACGTHMVMISSDYVFDGQAGPYGEDAPPNPINAYGRSKLAGERAVAELLPSATIVRLAWLYGRGGPSFLHTMLRLARSPETPAVHVVTDQSGSPTSAPAVADGLAGLIDPPAAPAADEVSFGRADPPTAGPIAGPVHLTCTGGASRYEFAQAIWAAYGLTKPLEPCTGERFPCPAPRPADSRLDNRRLRRLNLPVMPHWRDALQEFARENPDG